MIPGVKKLLQGADLSGAEDELKRVEAIIDSMTRAGAPQRPHPEREPPQAHRARAAAPRSPR